MSKRNLRKILAITLSAFAPAAFAAENTDCVLSANLLRLVHGCIYTEGYGPGPCPSWRTEDALFGVNLKRVSATHFEGTAENGTVLAQVDYDGKTARMSLRAPGVAKSEEVLTVQDERIPEVRKGQIGARHTDWKSQRGASYSVSCNFGLSDVVDKIKTSAEAEMDRLGPAVDWNDPSAPSLATLQKGTVLKLNRDLTILPGSDTAQTYLVEQNGLMTLKSFNALRLQYRFGFAEFFNSNNGYIYKTSYPAGTAMTVVEVKTQTYPGGEVSYILALAPLEQGGPDPIVRMNVTGRRSGRGDMKIPQFVELLKPAFDVILPH